MTHRLKRGLDASLLLHAGLGPYVALATYECVANLGDEQTELVHEAAPAVPGSAQLADASQHLHAALVRVHVVQRRLHVTRAGRGKQRRPKVTSRRSEKRATWCLST